MASQGRYHRNIFKESKRYQSALMQRSDLGQPSYVVDADFRDWSDIILRLHQRGMSDVWRRLDGAGLEQDNLPAVQHSWAVLPPDVAEWPLVTLDNNFVVSGRVNRLLEQDRSSPEHCASAYLGGLRATLFGDTDFECTLLSGEYSTTLADGIHRKYTAIEVGYLEDDRASWSRGFFDRQVAAGTPCYVRLYNGVYQIVSNTETRLNLANFNPSVVQPGGAAIAEPLAADDRYYWITLRSNEDEDDAAQAKIYLDVHLEDHGRQEDPSLDHNPGGSPVEGMRRNKLIQQLWISYPGSDGAGVPEFSQPTTDYTDLGGVRHHVRFLGNIRLQAAADADTPTTRIREVAVVHDNNVVNGRIDGGEDIDDGRDSGGVSGGSPHFYTDRCYSQVGVNGRAPTIIGDLDDRGQVGGVDIDTLITEWSQQPSDLAERLLRDGTVATVGAVKVATTNMFGTFVPGQYFAAQGIQAALDCPEVTVVHVKAGFYDIGAVKWTEAGNHNGVAHTIGATRGFISIPANKSLVLEDAAVLLCNSAEYGIWMASGTSITGGQIGKQVWPGFTDPSDGVVIRMTGNCTLDGTIVTSLGATVEQPAVIVAPAQSGNPGKVSVRNCSISCTATGIEVGNLASTNSVQGFVSITNCKLSSATSGYHAARLSSGGAVSLRDSTLVGAGTILYVGPSLSSVRNPSTPKVRYDDFVVSGNSFYATSATGTESCITLASSEVRFTDNAVNFALAPTASVATQPLSTIRLTGAPNTTSRYTVSGNILAAGRIGINVEPTYTHLYAEVSGNDVYEFNTQAPTLSGRKALIKFNTFIGTSFHGNVTVSGNSCTIVGSAVDGILGIGTGIISDNVILSTYTHATAPDLTNGIVCGLPKTKFSGMVVSSNLVKGAGHGILSGGSDTANILSMADYGDITGTGVSISDNLIFECGYGVFNFGVSAAVSGNTVSRTKYQGISCGATITNNKFSGNITGNSLAECGLGATTLGVENLHTVSLPGSQAANRYVGILAQGGTVSDNIITNLTTTAILANDGRVAIVGNKIDNCGEGIAVLPPCGDVTISGNDLRRIFSHGIRVGGDANESNTGVLNTALISNNRISAVRSYGQAIYIGRSSACSAIGNQVTWTYNPDGSGVTSPVLADNNGHIIAALGADGVTISSNYVSSVAAAYNTGDSGSSAATFIGSSGSRHSSRATVSNNVFELRNGNTALRVHVNGDLTVSANTITNSEKVAVHIGIVNRALVASSPSSSHKKTWSINGNTINGSGAAIFGDSSQANSISFESNKLTGMGVWAEGSGIAIKNNHIDMGANATSNDGDVVGTDIATSGIYVGGRDGAITTTTGASRKSDLMNSRNDNYFVEISGNTVIGHSLVGQKLTPAGTEYAYNDVDAPKGRGACIVAMVGRESRICNNDLRSQSFDYHGAIGILLGNMNMRSKTTPTGTTTPYGRIPIGGGTIVEGNKLNHGMKLVACIASGGRLSIKGNVFKLGTAVASEISDAFGGSAAGLVQLYHSNYEAREFDYKRAVVNFNGNEIVLETEYWDGASAGNAKFVGYVMTSCGRCYPEEVHEAATDGAEDLSAANIAVVPARHNYLMQEQPAGYHTSNTHFESPYWLTGIGITKTQSDFGYFPVFDHLEIANPGFRYYGPRATSGPVRVVNLETNNTRLDKYVHDHTFDEDKFEIDNGPKIPGGEGAVTYKLDHYEDFNDGAGAGWGPAVE